MQLTHSYSGIKDFQGCPRRYHQVKILKRFKQEHTQATLYGTQVHKAFEEYIRDGTPLPEAFQKYAEFVDPLLKFSGEIKCEEKLGVTRDFKPCAFDAEDVWLRGIPDFVALNLEKGVARVGDFKTGKSARFADPGQLELMAALIMAHHPQIQKVKTALLFVVANSIVQSSYTRQQLPLIWKKWAGHAKLIEKAVELDKWHPIPSPLCKFCPLPPTECEHR